MNKLTHLITIGLLLLFVSDMTAQRPREIRFQSAVLTPGTKETPIVTHSSALQSCRFEETYFTIITFLDIPDQKTKEKLNKAGVKLLAYLPRNAYWARIPATVNLSSLPVASILLPQPHYKLSAALLPSRAHCLTSEPRRLCPSNAFQSATRKPR